MAVLGRGLAERVVLVGPLPAAQDHAVPVQAHVAHPVVQVALLGGMLADRDQAAPGIVLAGRRAGLEAAVGAVAVVVGG